ncbi:putative WD repeat-containing protein [Colletotrichum gloeosporioides]|uniref:Putative WD repeat-containing protein n=1 Tax=Colletotrichum gloeosporioides TaxID=474922 RepID=A0A8H4CG51_COLGL|nr:putative WD repeat-containing protein [Colletotrichum gloeosporioides]KAF3803385.1 putative WD repeat-containing protein [Colletotrichum gloeosporioides]
MPSNEANPVLWGSPAQTGAAFDFRSDVVTTPSQGMLLAIARTTLHDDVYGEDSTTRNFEEEMAKTCGHESAAFVLSGTMANQLAIRSLLHQPPHAVLADASAHIIHWEAGGVAHLSGAMVQGIRPANGLYLTLEDIKKHAVLTDDLIPGAATAPVPPKMMHPSRQAYVEEAMDEDRGIALEDIPVDHDYEIPSAASGVAPEKASAVLAQMERKKLAASIAVPTDDNRVRARLRELGEPITLFGEGKPERRDRLRNLLAIQKEMDDVDVEMQEAGDDDADDQDEEFYTPGGPALLQARIDLVKYSLPRARRRVQFQKAESTIPLRTHVKFRKQIKEKLEGFELQGSQTAGDRNVSMTRLSPNGEIVAVGNWGGGLKLIEVPSLEQKMNLRGHTNKISGLSWYPGSTLPESNVSPNTVNVASGGAEGVVHLWGLEQDTPLSTLSGHSARVSRVEFHPSGRYVASASDDTTWRLWDVETTAELLLQEGHSRGVYAVSFNADGSLLASAGLDSIGRIWDLRSGRTVMILDEHIQPIYALDWGSDGHRVLSGSADGWVKCWDVRKVQRTANLGAHTKAVSDLRWFKGTDDPIDGHPPGVDESGAQQPKKAGTFFVSGGFDAKVKIFSADNWGVIQTLSGHAGPVSSVDVLRGQIGSRDLLRVAWTYRQPFHLLRHTLREPHRLDHFHNEMRDRHSAQGRKARLGPHPISGVNFIYQAGVLLDLPQITLWVAGVFFHRFYMRYSMVEEKGGIHHYTQTSLPRSKRGTQKAQAEPELTDSIEQNIAATALFLANKTEENCRKTKEIIITVAKVAQKNPKLMIDEMSKEYWRWRDSILAYEELMLELLTFDLMVDNPYQRLFELLGQLDIVHNKHLRQSAWAWCNDACLTSIPLLLEARDVAICAIFFASVHTKNKIEDVNGEPWWKALKGNERKCTRAIDIMQQFYTENPLRKQNPSLPSPAFDLENTRQPRDPMSQDALSSTAGTPFELDRGTQSPRARINGRDDVTNTESGSQATLKEPERANGNGAVSPGKRKEVESDSEGRDQKRARLSDEDEGEVLD